VPSHPLISVVIPVHGVENYLSGCLDSILGQQFGELEVIAVDDASPDGCGKLLDARAEQDPRLRVLHRDQAGGPGSARNAGLEQAAGQYVWFVDADDLVAAGALAAVAARLEQDRPDVLLLDFEELRSGGRAAPSPGRALLRAAPPGTFPLAEQPQLIELTMTSWSKLFRRDFLRGLGVPFPAGIHEDVPVTCAALLRADRIAALAQVCYRYRRDRRGSFMVTTSDLQFGIFGAYQRVFETMECLRQAGRPPGDALARAVFDRAIWHYTTVLQATRPGAGLIGGGSLVPRRRRREFFARMSADFRKYRPAGWAYPGGARGVKFRLVEKNAYLAYSALEPVNQLRVLLGRAVSRLSAGAGHVSEMPGSEPPADS
jgi:CDP-glycerol glycerophosphotransferase